MTINQLHKITAALLAKGMGRRGVCIAKDTFRHPLEADGCVMLPAESAEMQSFELMDADGGMDTRRDGTVKTSLALVIYGSEKGAAS